MTLQYIIDFDADISRILGVLNRAEDIILRFPSRHHRQQDELLDTTNTHYYNNNNSTSNAPVILTGGRDDDEDDVFSSLFLEPTPIGPNGIHHDQQQHQQQHHHQSSWTYSSTSNSAQEDLFDHNFYSVSEDDNNNINKTHQSPPQQRSQMQMLDFLFFANNSGEQQEQEKTRPAAAPAAPTAAPEESATMIMSRPSKRQCMETNNARMMMPPPVTTSFAPWSSPPQEEQQRISAMTTVTTPAPEQEQSEESRFRTYQADQWMDRYQDMADFKEKNGHCLVPHNFPENQQLAQWVKRQRYQYKLKNMGRHSTLTDARQTDLEAMGFIWDSHKAAWCERYETLKEFRVQFGHCNVPSHYDVDDRSLAVWVKCQRRQMKLFNKGVKSTMNEERFVALDEIGFDWNPRNL